MSNVITTVGISGADVAAILCASRSSTREDFDLEACLSLVGELGQNVDDAIKFAEIFTLHPGYDGYKSMDELQLTLAMSKYGVTAKEVLEFDDTLHELEYDSEMIENRNAYLAARNRGISHKDAVKHIFYPQN